MSTSSPEAIAKPSSPTLSRAALKSAKASKIVIFKLSSYLLTQFPYEDSEPKPAPPVIKSKASHARSTDAVKPESSSTADSESKANSNSNITTNGEGETPTNKESKRKGVPGPKPGSKRSAPTADPDGNPKPRGKPGPKKRKTDGENGVPVPAPAPKLGPKANLGAINAQLRALDRTGKPCRRWGKRTIMLKSFTGVGWDLPYWQSPKFKRDDLTNDARSQGTSSSDPNKEPTSSQIASDSNAGKESSNAPLGNSDVNGNSFAATSKPADSDSTPAQDSIDNPPVEAAAVQE